MNCGFYIYSEYVWRRRRRNHANFQNNHHRWHECRQNVPCFPILWWPISRENWSNDRRGLPGEKSDNRWRRNESSFLSFFIVTPQAYKSVFFNLYEAPNIGSDLRKFVTVLKNGYFYQISSRRHGILGLLMMFRRLSFRLLNNVFKLLKSHGFASKQQILKTFLYAPYYFSKWNI